MTVVCFWFLKNCSGIFLLTKKTNKQKKRLAFAAIQFGLVLALLSPGGSWMVHEWEVGGCLFFSFLHTGATCVMPLKESCCVRDFEFALKLLIVVISSSVQS